MNLDIHTLLATMLASVFAIAIAIPAVMGWRVSPAARHVVASAVAHALAWGCFLLARPVHDRIFSTLWIALLGACFAFMWHALRGWLGPRPGERLLHVLVVLTPLGYGIGFETYAFRVGWSNFGLAGLMGLVCLACLWPAPSASRRWRGLVAVCLGTLAAVTLTRGVLGAFYTELYPTLRSPHPVNLVGAVLNHITLMLTTIGLLVGWHEEAERGLREQADTDGLTGLLNRRAWRKRADAAIATARRRGERVALLMIDIDHFKQINDRWGHETGDRALEQMGAMLRQCARRSDLLCRYGGEEFCLLLVGADEASARDVDARLRAALTGDTAREPRFTICFSGGLAVLGDADPDVRALMRRADAALYEAKASGRARLVRADEALATRTGSSAPERKRA
jgi:diguanylate cyclase (GGDEF)-like protein